MKRLIITDNPGVASAVAEALGLPEPGADWTENARFAVCSGGNWFVPAAPADCDPHWGVRDPGLRPLIPPEFRYTLRAESETRFRTLVRLMDRPDIDGIVNACDASGAGELLFRLLYEHAGCSKPAERLWLTSLEPQAVRRSMDRLRAAAEHDEVCEAARARRQADWLVSVNATRLVSCRGGRLHRLSRLTGPLLRLLAEQEAAAAGCTGRKYRVRLQAAGVWAQSGLLPLPDARSLRQRCESALVRCEKTETGRGLIRPPKLFSLSTLQQTANRLFALTAAQTLRAAQSLYEKRLLTYPRSGSCYLTDDMGLAALRAAAASGLVQKDLRRLDPAPVLASRRVGAHHAVIPTAAAPESQRLTHEERQIYMLCARRLAAAMLPPCVSESLLLELHCAGALFTCRAHRVVEPGWRAAELPGDGTGGLLPAFQPGQEFLCPRTEIVPADVAPAYCTDASLLTAMERAEGKRRGSSGQLGPPAGWSAAIEQLIVCGYAARTGNIIRLTRRGRDLLDLLPERLTAADVVFAWEKQLAAIAAGRGSAAAFLRDVRAFVRELVSSGADPGPQPGSAPDCP